MRALLLCALAALLAAAPARGAVVRGVRPDHSDKYAGAAFKCLDGSKTIQASQINDNYCDCADGSDEPGTPACPNGAFYCRNRGHEAKLLSTSFVDDGICDCCDGSDELSGCSNTCIELNAEVREKLKAKVADYKRALETKAAYVAQAPQLRDQLVQRQQSIDGIIAEKETEVSVLRAESVRLAEIEAANPPPPPPSPEPTAAQQEADAVAAAQAASAEAAAALAAEEQQEQAGEAHEETAEERGRRIASQWTNDPAAAGSADQAAGVGGTPPANAPDQGWLGRTLSSVKQAVATAVGGADAPPAAADAPPAAADAGSSDDNAGQKYLDDVYKNSPEYQAEAGSGGDADLAADYPPLDDYRVDEGLGTVPGEAAAVTAPPPVETPAQVAATKLREAEAALQALQDERALLERQVGYDYGPDAEWLALRSRCVEARQPQYSYRACLFDKAAQVDVGGGHETSLGSWKGFENGYTEAVFEGGDWCYQAPARSLRIKLWCGLEESSWDASEPSTCVYQSNVASPAVCNEPGLKLLQDQLDKVLAEEAALRAEIEAEEKERQAALAAAAKDRDEL